MQSRLPSVLHLAELPASLVAERVTPLAAGSAFRIEHILSGGHVSPPGFWYDQPQAEWAVLLSGRATVQFEQGSVELGAGDAVLIPPRARHRVAASAGACWLALHFAESDGSAPS